MAAETDMAAKTHNHSWFLPDVPKSSDEDQLDLDPIAEQTAHAVRCLPERTCIGLIGRFGVGKSTIANITKQKLQNDRLLDAVCVSVDKHSGIARSRSLVHSVASQIENNNSIKPKHTNAVVRPLWSAQRVSMRDPTRTPLVDLLKGTAKLGKPDAVVLAILGLAAVGLAALAVIAPPWLPLQPAVSVILSVSTALAAAVFAFVKPAMRESDRPRAEAPDDVQRVFSQLMDLYNEREMGKHLAIFIDDIDRLDPDDVMDAFRAIKSLQSAPGDRSRPTFVVSCDEDIVREAISRSSDAPSGEVGSETQEPMAVGACEAAQAFLDKFFSLKIIMPSSVQGDMRDFASHAIDPQHPIRDKLGQEDFDRVMTVLVTEHVASPREAIRRVNAFLSAYQLAERREGPAEQGSRIQEGEVTGTPVLLARLTVLRSAFPVFYERLKADDALLEACDRFLLGRTLDGTQRDVLACSGVFAARGATASTPDAQDDDDTGDGGCVASEEDAFEWAEEWSRLRRYLLSTARYMPREYPPTLAPLIYLSHTPSGRVLGNQLLATLAQAVREGRSRDVEWEIQTAPVEQHRDIAKELGRQLDRSARVDLPNVIAGTVPVLEQLSEGRHDLADCAAWGVEKVSSPLAVDGEHIAVLLEHAPDVHVEALERALALVDIEPEDGSLDVDQRMRTAATYLVEADRRSAPVEAALQDYLARVDQSHGWEVGRAWLSLARRLADAGKTELVGQQALPALVRLAGGAADFELENEGQDLVELAQQTLVSIDEREMMSAVLGLTEGAALLTLGIRLIEVMNPEGTPEASLFMARAIATSKATEKERGRELERLTAWVNVWGQAQRASSTGEEADSWAKMVIERITAAAKQTPPGMLPEMAEFAESAAQYGPASEVDALARELIPPLEAAHGRGDAAELRRAAQSLEQLIGYVQADTARQLEDALRGWD